MKFRYKKSVKRRIGDRHFRKGDIVELERLEGAYPENWFELVEEEEKVVEKKLGKIKKKESEF